MYTHCTLQDNQVLWWYNVLDWEWDHHQDFDVLEWWAVYLFEATGAFIAEYKPVHNCIWSYKTEAEALQAICNNVNSYKKMRDNMDKAKESFDAIVKANSLEERYKNHKNYDAPATKQKKETPKSKYLDRLREKAQAKPYAKFQENLEKVKNLSARIQRKYYANSYDYLLEH